MNTIHTAGDATTPVNSTDDQRPGKQKGPLLFRTHVIRTLSGQELRLVTGGRGDNNGGYTANRPTRHATG